MLFIKNIYLHSKNNIIMAKKLKTDTGIEKVENVLGKTEEYIQNNKKSLTVIISVIVLIILGYVSYKYLYIPSKSKSAAADSFKAEKYLSDAIKYDSINLYKNALNGDGQSIGFIKIADDYSMTKLGNLANYSAGIAFLHTGDFKKAIEYFNKYEAEDELTASLAFGCTGDAYSELKDYKNAIIFYNKAIEFNNKFTAPLYLEKIGRVYYSQKNYKSSLDSFKKILKKYNESSQAVLAEKYIYKLENKISK